MKKINLKLISISLLSSMILFGCGQSSEDIKKEMRGEGALSSDVAARSYVAPGQLDEYYAFISGGFSGQLSVYGIPSGRLFKVIPVFSVDAEKAYGFNEETKPMLETSHGFVPWDDSHHPELSQTNGETDGRWIFINGNNTPRIAKIDLKTFETTEIIEIPNSAGNHSSPFTTENTEYVVAGTRFSVPFQNKDMPINEYKGNFKGALTFIKVDPKHGEMNIAFQVLMPGFNYDLAHSGKGKSHGWTFFTTYNTEEGNSLLEVNASQNDKDYIAAINWKKAEQYIKEGKFHEMPGKHVHNIWDESTQSATSKTIDKVKVLIPEELPGLVYFLPNPKSPHGVDVDPSGEYIVGNGKLSANLTIHSFTKMIKAIEEKKFDGEAYGIPILDFDATHVGTLKQAGLGPLHTEFDDKGNAYTSFFISSEVVKWKLGTWEVIDRKPTYYSIGHLTIPGGDSKKPTGKYLIAMNKITKDRFLSTGPEVSQSAQLYDISGEKMELLLDFPTVGEPHYAQAIHRDKVHNNTKKIYKLEDNNHPYATKSEKEAKVVRNGNIVHVYMTSIRSHFAPDNIEGLKVGDKVYCHVTNLEQDYDVPHGFSILGATNSEILIMPGQTETLFWEPKKVGIVPFYCTDFCSALHQEMSGYFRVSPKTSSGKLTWSLDGE